jgi:GNAT superfamily N-acetyltransferase
MRDCSLVIRLAVFEDVGVIPEVERRAGAQFREIGMESVADAPPSSRDVIAAAVEQRRVWVYDDGAGPVAFIIAKTVVDCAHIVQVSVVPERRGERLGAALIDQVESWAVSEGLRALTLITFRDVPWNRPYYERLGFTGLHVEPGTGLAELFDEESEGLDPRTRVAMWRRVVAA